MITPSLPTLFIASAMMLPIVWSPFAETVPTCAIASPLTGFERRLISSVARSTALSMPRLRAIGFAPAAAVSTPSRKIAWARTVAVVVPSPATSEVFEATSRTICAPMFSSESFSSISFATVTPSLVIVGEPNFVDNDVAAFWTKGDLHCIGELIDTAQNRRARLFTMNHLLLPSLLTTFLSAAAGCAGAFKFRESRPLA